MGLKSISFTAVRRSLGRYSSLADSDHGVFFYSCDATSGISKLKKLITHFFV
jgi:hypothetical protein